MIIDGIFILLLFLIGTAAAALRWGRLGVAVIGLLLHHVREGGSTIKTQLSATASKWCIWPLLLFIVLISLHWVCYLDRPTSMVFKALARAILVGGVP